MPDNYKFQPTQRDLTEAVKRQNFQPQEQNKSVVAPPNLFQRLTGAVNGFITGGLWTPGAPNNPIAPGGTPPRQMDYPITFNIDIAPRSGMAIKFEELMALADSSDLTRMVIERRKDQMAKLKWSIQYRDDKSDKDVNEDEGAQYIQGQLQYPDNEHNFSTFQRAMLEEVLVKDALGLEPVYRPEGTFDPAKPETAVYGFYGIAGETIQLKIDERGRTPEPPNTAYQQVIKGVPFCDFSKDDLIYRPWNLRFSRMFGFSKVEQLYILINIALRREMQQLYAFTEGNMPAALMEAQEGWTPEQIFEYQDYFDSKYSGDLKKRSRMSVVPHGTQLHPYTADPLKNEFDEWMARLICFCFGISPSGFVKEMNRATAFTASAAAATEGLEPLMAYIEELWTYILAKCYRRPDLQFTFNTDDEIDPGTASKIAMDEIDHGCLSVDDFLEAKGKDAIGVGYVFKTPAGPISVEAWLANGGVPPQAGPAAGAEPEPTAEPTPAHSNEGPDLGKASKAALPKGHLARLPMPNAASQKKSSKLNY